MSTQNVRIFVELDAVLDTRLGLLQFHDPGLLETYPLQAYANRLIDEFPGWSYDKFKALYEKRGDDALTHATMTNMVTVLYELVKAASKDMVLLPITTTPEIILNVWPYKFDEEETKSLVANFGFRFEPFARVAAVNIPLAQLTPDKVITTMDRMILYNANEWLTLQNTALKKTRIPQIEGYCPALYQGRVLQSHEIKKFGNATNIFEPVRREIAPLVGLDFIDIEAYCPITASFTKRLVSKPDRPAPSSKSSADE